MSKGIIVFGANGSGKSTLARELARVLSYKHMDVEDYYFEKSEVPYSISRTKVDVIKLMLEDIKDHGSFVLSSVTGEFGVEIEAFYEFAVYLSAPLEIRLDRVKCRA
jgi:cytidylate kinase